MVVISETLPCRKEAVYEFVQKRCQELEEKRNKNVPNLESFELVEVLTEEQKKQNSKYTMELMQRFFKDTAKHFREAEIIGNQINTLNVAVKNLNNFKVIEKLERRRRIEGGNTTETAEKIGDGPSAPVKLPVGVKNFINNLDGDENSDSIRDLFYRRSSTPISIADSEEFRLFGRIEDTEFDSFHQKIKYLMQYHEQIQANTITPSVDRDHNKNKVKVQQKKTQTPQFTRKKASIEESNKKSLVPDCPPGIKAMLEEVKRKRVKSQQKVQVPMSVVNLQI